MPLPTNEYVFEVQFVDLFKKHEYRFYTLAARFTKSDQFAKDIVEDIFLQLWQKRDTILDESSAEKCLYQLAESKILHFLQRAAAHTSVRDALWVNMQRTMCCDSETGSPNNFNLLIENAIRHLAPQRRDIYTSSNDNYIIYHYIKKNIYPRGLGLGRKGFISRVFNEVKRIYAFKK